MEYMLLIMSRRGEAPRESVDMAEMGKYAAALGPKLRGGAPLLAEEQGVRVRVRNGQTETTDGPFAESKEVIGGYFMLDAPSAAEALELAKRCPAARSGFVQLHAASVDHRSDPASEGKRYLFLFLMDRAYEEDPEEAKFHAMDRWILSLEAQKRHVQCARLSDDGKRIELRGGAAQVLDGPFAESKEVVGGYSILLARSRDEAVALARGCPHATWGIVEVREVMDVPGPR